MQRTLLGRSDIEVSTYCLGTMTFGTNTTEDKSHEQLDLSLDQGINFLDTAEMYPVNPVKKETATKCTGVNGSFVREGEMVSGKTIRSACESSLKRLQTDYIDLYQLHWPNRGSYHFRQIWDYDPSQQDRATALAHMEDVMSTLKALVGEGKIRSFGLSNESAWGTDKWLAASERLGGPRVESIQNEYSVLCRMPFDGDLAELCHNEAVTLLAFSPLATGFVTGKYLDGARPKGSRLDIIGESPRESPRLDDAVRAFVDVAKKHAIDPVHMAMSFCLQRPFPCIPIFGATNTAQLEHLLAGSQRGRLVGAHSL